MSETEGQLQDYSVDQLGGFVVMVAGAIGSLLLVVWQSKCHCRMNLCYIFQCERRPPSEEEMKSLKDQAKKLKDAKDKKDKDKKDKDKDLEKGEDTPKTPRATLTGDEELTYIPGPVPAAPSP
tara:strand:+ start:51 stop:419 length:369 start_codon:yes stop_codon:yes gene_type:complete